MCKTRRIRIVRYKSEETEKGKTVKTPLFYVCKINRAVPDDHRMVTHERYAIEALCSK